MAIYSLFIATFESFVQNTNPLNTVTCLIFVVEFKAHFDFLVLFTFVGELIGNVWVLVIAIQYYVFILRIAHFQSLIVVLVVFAELWDSKVKCYYFGGTFTRSYFY